MGKNVILRLLHSFPSITYSLDSLEIFVFSFALIHPRSLQNRSPLLEDTTKALNEDRDDRLIPYSYPLFTFEFPSVCLQQIHCIVPKAFDKKPFGAKVLYLPSTLTTYRRKGNKRVEQTSDEWKKSPRGVSMLGQLFSSGQREGAFFQLHPFSLSIRLAHDSTPLHPSHSPADIFGLIKRRFSLQTCHICFARCAPSSFLLFPRFLLRTVPSAIVYLDYNLRITPMLFAVLTGNSRDSVNSRDGS